MVAKGKLLKIIKPHIRITLITHLGKKLNSDTFSLENVIFKIHGRLPTWEQTRWNICCIASRVGVTRQEPKIIYYFWCFSFIVYITFYEITIRIFQMTFLLRKQGSFSPIWIKAHSTLCDDENMNFINHGKLELNGNLRHIN